LELHLEPLKLFTLLALGKGLCRGVIAYAFEKSWNASVPTVASIALGSEVRSTEVGQLLQRVFFEEWLDVAALRVVDAVVTLHASY